MSLFDQDYKEPKAPQLPTLKQYLKECTDKHLQQTFQVDVIWYPNRYPNYTLETHAWRLRVPVDTALYKSLEEFCNEQIHGVQIQAIGVKVTDRKNVIFVIEPMKKKGRWEEISSSGMKWVD